MICLISILPVSSLSAKHICCGELLAERMITNYSRWEHCICRLYLAMTYPWRWCINYFFLSHCHCLLQHIKVAHEGLLYDNCYMLKLPYSTKVLFHNNFCPSGEQPEHRKLAHELWQPTVGCIAIFHKYCCYTKCGGITTNIYFKCLFFWMKMCEFWIWFDWSLLLSVQLTIIQHWSR